MLGLVSVEIPDQLRKCVQKQEVCVFSTNPL